MKNQKKINGPFVIEMDKVYVIVQEQNGDVYVTCPFQSCKVGFVDILDKVLSSSFLPGVIQYHKIDDFLTCVQISENNLISIHTASILVRKALGSLLVTKDSFDEDRIKLAQEFKENIIKSGLVQVLV